MNFRRFLEFNMMLSKLFPRPHLAILGLAFGAAGGAYGAEATTPGVGTAAEPVRYIGGETADASHDGALRWAVGVKSWQALRADRAHPELSDDWGYTYNHAPMIAYWHDRFYVEYLSAPFHENKGGNHTLVMQSVDGIHWDKPKVVFPFYKLPDDTVAETHQRMGFYVAPNGRLLVLAFYGIPNHPNDGNGVGRAVSEARPDGTFGPVYFIRYNRQNGWNESNTAFPFYTTSPDAGFKQACEALLANKLMTLQWLEEDRAKDGFFPDLGGKILKAFSFYHRADGTVVGLWKSSWSALSHDEGRTWTPPVQAKTLVMAQAKISGQRTPDGRYALVYNPRPDNRHRWPLAVVTGDDGITFDHLLVVQGEVPLRRYNGLDKAYGPQYNRAIAEGNGRPPGKGFWVTYSMNKEDIWVSRIPTPVTGTVSGPVHDTFNEGNFEDSPWITYSPRLAPVEVVDFPAKSDRSLQLTDRDPVDCARATRVFQSVKQGFVRFKVYPHQADHGSLEVELTDRHGSAPIRLWFDDQGRVMTMAADVLDSVKLTRYVQNEWIDVLIRFDLTKDTFDVLVDSQPLLMGAEILNPSEPLERLVFRTGAFNEHPTLRDPKSPGVDIPGADEPDPVATFNLDDVSAGPIEGDPHAHFPSELFGK